MKNKNFAIVYGSEE